MASALQTAPTEAASSLRGGGWKSTSECSLPALLPGGDVQTPCTHTALLRYLTWGCGERDAFGGHGPPTLWWEWGEKRADKTKRHGPFKGGIRNGSTSDPTPIADLVPKEYDWRLLGQPQDFQACLQAKELDLLAALTKLQAQALTDAPDVTDWLI